MSEKILRYKKFSHTLVVGQVWHSAQYPDIYEIASISPEAGTVSVKVLSDGEKMVTGPLDMLVSQVAIFYKLESEGPNFDGVCSVCGGTKKHPNILSNPGYGIDDKNKVYADCYACDDKHIS